MGYRKILAPSTRRLWQCNRRFPQLGTMTAYDPSWMIYLQYSFKISSYTQNLRVLEVGPQHVFNKKNDDFLMLFMCVYVCVLFIFLAFQHFFFWGISSPSCAAAWKISSWPLKGRSWWLWTYSRIPTAFSTLRKPGFSRLVLPSINEKIIGIIYI